MLQRKRTSRIAQQNSALIAINGGFFSYDGAAVGAVLSNNEWIRLPWGGRTAVGFRKDGSARIDTLQAQARVVLEDIGADAFKTGMLGSPEVVAAVARITLTATGRFSLVSKARNTSPMPPCPMRASTR